MKNGKAVRGSRVSIDIAASASAGDILQQAVSKISAHNSNVYSSTVTLLLYPDGKQVQSLRESGEPFTLKGYRDELSRDYQRIILYVSDEGG